MSDTPRTDAWLKDYYETYGSPPGVPSTLDWAQKLEREVAELREALEKANTALHGKIAYIDFWCSDYPSCGCANYTKEDCAALKGKAKS